MNTSPQLALLLAFALAALAVAATPASATTVTPDGPFTAHSTAIVFADSQTGESITCGSDITGTVTVTGTGPANTLDTLTFTNCQQSAGADCTMFAGGLPSTITVSDNPDRMVVHNDVMPDFSCRFGGFPVYNCTVSGGNLELTIDDSTDPTLIIVDEHLDSATGSTDCTGGITVTGVYELTIAGVTHPIISA